MPPPNSWAGGASLGVVIVVIWNSGGALLLVSVTLGRVTPPVDTFLRGGTHAVQSTPVGHSLPLAVISVHLWQSVKRSVHFWGSLLLASTLPDTHACTDTRMPTHTQICYAHYQSYSTKTKYGVTPPTHTG